MNKIAIFSKVTTHKAGKKTAHKSLTTHKRDFYVLIITTLFLTILTTSFPLKNFEQNDCQTHFSQNGKM